MSERPHATAAAPENSPVFSRAYTIATTVAAGGGGALAGSIIANYRYPTSIDYADGIHATASLTLSPDVVVDTPVSKGVAPNVPVDTPFPGIDGIHTTIDQLQLNFSNKRSQGEYIGLLTNFHDAVVKPTAENIVNHLALGAGIGAATAAGISYGLIRYARRGKRDEADTRADIQMLREQGSDEAVLSAYNQEARLLRTFRDRKIGALILSGLALVGAGLTARDAIKIESASSKSGKPLASILTDQVPELRGARITGGADQINTVIYAINNQKERADKVWKLGYKNLNPALNNYYAQFGKRFEDDSDIQKIVQVSDLHCNLSNYRYFFGKALPKLDPDVVTVTGDTQTNSGTTFYEKTCVPGLVNIVNETRKSNNKTIPVVYEAGNHDDKKPFDGGKDFFNLTKKQPVFKLQVAKNPDGSSQMITFVGQQDPRKTIWYPTLPDNKDAENKLLAEQGREVSAEACRQKQPDKTVVAMTHSEQAGYATILNGCADLVLNGHTHHENEPTQYTSLSGETVIQHTSGSTSGAGERFSIYERPQQDASMSVFYYSKSKQKFVGYYTTTLHPDGDIRIKYGTLPSQQATEADLARMGSYDRTYAQQPAKQENASAATNSAGPK